MELGNLVRETRGLGAGALARSGSAFLLEEGRLRHDTRRVQRAATRKVEAKPRSLEEEELTSDLWHRPVYPIAFGREARQVTIGRGTICNVRIDVSSVSSVHSAIVADGKGGFALKDAGSTNGTFLDGAPIGRDEAVPLASGAVVRFGPEVRLTFLSAAAMEHLLRQLDPLLRKAAAAEGKGGEGDLPAYLDEDDTPPPAKRSGTGKAASPAPAVPAEPPLALVCLPFPPVGLVSGIPVTVGRVVGNDLILPHPQVSRQHARFERETNALFVVDLGSANGVWRAKERLGVRASLGLGGTVSIGPYSIRVVDVAAPPPRVAPDGATRVAPRPRTRPP